MPNDYLNKVKLNGTTYDIKDTVSGYTTNTGTVTDVTAGTGLSGGTISTSGTISLDTDRALTTSDITTGTATDNKLVSAKTIHDALPTVPTVVNTYSSTGTDAISGTGVAAALGTLDSSISATTNQAISAITITDGKISGSSKITIPTVTDTYSSTGTDAVSGKAVNAALQTLDSSISAETGKAISAIGIVDGKITSSSKISVGDANQNAFSNVKVGTTTIEADSTTDTLELVAGSNITLTPDATNDKVTIAFNNDSGYITGITSSDVTSALGYTPYSNANPSGYTSNTGTVTSIGAGTGLKTNKTSNAAITDSGTLALDTTYALTASDISTGTDTTNKLVSAKTIADAIGGFGGGTVTSVSLTNASGESDFTITGSPITSAGTITIDHANSVTAKSTQGLYPITFDKHGHITGAGDAVTVTDTITSWYGTCSTTASTVQKDVTCSNYVLNTGNVIGVLFSTGNTAATPTLKVGSTAAKSIYVGNATPNDTTNVLKWSANTMIYFMYDGTYYRYITSVSAASVQPSRGGNNWVGTSSSSLTTSAKTATIDNYVLTPGSVVYITFTNGSNALQALTLNINSTGAKSIYYKGAATSTTNTLTWSANETLVFVYSGLYYFFVGKTNAIIPSDYLKSSYTGTNFDATINYIDDTDVSGAAMTATNSDGSSTSIGVGFEGTSAVITATNSLSENMGHVSVGINGPEMVGPDTEFIMRSDGALISSLSGEDNIAICNLIEPFNDSDAATKKYVDDAVGGITAGVSDVKVGVTGSTSSIVTSGVAELITNTAYNSSSNKIATMSDLPSVPSAGTSATAVSTTSSGGSASTYSKSDHVHSISSSTITSALGFTPSSTDTITTWYGTSSTTASTAEKAVTCSGFDFHSGAIVGVLFSTANTAATPTLNVNTKGAKTIYVGGNTALSDTNPLKWSANTMVYFMYDGTYFRYITSISAASIIPSRGANTWYGTSSTGATTAAKTSTITNFVLSPGTLVSITFSTANTYASGAITLNVSSTGAKNVYYNGAVTSSSNQCPWLANDTITFMYDGTGYQFISRSSSDVSYIDGVYGAHVTNSSLPGKYVVRYGVCSIGASTAAKTVTLTNGTPYLNAGTHIFVNFSNKNTATSPTLNVNSTGAKTIKPDNAVLDGICEFVYDGTYWQLVSANSFAVAGNYSTGVTIRTWS